MMVKIVLILVALALNFKDYRMFALTFIVGASILAVPPKHSYDAFFVFCISFEIFVMLCALALRANASEIIIVIGLAMLVAHGVAYKLDGSPPFSPYRIIMITLEHAQIVACLLLSNPLKGRLKNHEPPTI